MASLGELVVNLTMNSQGFTQGARDASDQADRLANKIQNRLLTAQERYNIAQNRLKMLFDQGKISASQYKLAMEDLGQSQGQLGQKSLMAQQNLTQIAFAAEDAAVSFGTGGLAGSIRGASNNLVMIAANMGGAKGAMAAVGIVATVQLVPALLKATGVMDDMSKSLERVKESAENAFEYLGRIREFETKELAFEFELMNIQNMDKAEAAAAAVAKHTKEIQELNAENLKIDEHRGILHEELVGRQRVIREGGGLWGTGIGVEGALEKVNVTYAEELDRLEEKRIKNQEELTRQIKLRLKAAEQEQKLAKQEEAEAEAEQQRKWEEEYQSNRERGRQKQREDERRAREQEQEEAERAAEQRRKKQEKDAESAKKMERDLIQEQDPNERRSAERKIMWELEDRLQKIQGMSISAEHKAHLTRSAKMAAATQLAGLGGSGATPAPIEAMAKGSKEALMSVLQAQMKSKEDPKESTQIKIEKHLANIEKDLAKKDGFEVGAFGGP